MSNYTVLTVFENTDTINEPVIALPIIGKASFRQIGIIVGLAVILPMMIYSAGSEAVRGAFPDPAFSFTAVNGQIKITWDVLLALAPIPLGLALGMPRPKLVPMDKLIVILVRFAMHRTSVRSSTQKKAKRKSETKSSYAGFAHKDDITPVPSQTRNYDVAVTDLGIPKNLTITLYDLKGSPMRHKLVRAYIDDELLSSITTDSDGVIGMTFVPKSEGAKRLKVVADGISGSVVDATLDVKRCR